MPRHGLPRAARDRSRRPRTGPRRGAPGRPGRALGRRRPRGRRRHQQERVGGDEVEGRDAGPVPLAPRRGGAGRPGRVDGTYWRTGFVTSTGGVPSSTHRSRSGAGRRSRAAGRACRSARPGPRRRRRWPPGPPSVATAASKAAFASPGGAVDAAGHEDVDHPEGVLQALVGVGAGPPAVARCRRSRAGPRGAHPRSTAASFHTRLWASATPVLSPRPPVGREPVGGVPHQEGAAPVGSARPAGTTSARAGRARSPGRGRRSPAAARNSAAHRCGRVVLDRLGARVPVVHEHPRRAEVVGHEHAGGGRVHGPVEGGRPLPHQVRAGPPRRGS